MEDLVNQLKELIAPELLCLVPVLYFLGVLIKRSRYIKDKNIPLVLGIIGILLAVMWTITTGETAIINIMFTSITQGIMCAGLAVYINQLIKQRRKSDE